MRQILLSLALVLVAVGTMAQPPAGDGSHVEILLPGEYLNDCAAVDGEVWWVLFSTPGEGVRLRYTPIGVSKQSGDYPCRVQANGFSENEVLLLFRGTKEIPRGPVATVFNGLLSLAPGTEIYFGEMRNTLSIQPFEPWTDSNLPVNVPSYGNYSISLLRGEAEKQTLFQTFWQNKEGRSNEFNSTLPSLIWAGDLDKDDKLDLLLSLSTHYAGGEVALYLSSYAKDGELVHLVAKAATPGGC